MTVVLSALQTLIPSSLAGRGKHSAYAPKCSISSKTAGLVFAERISLWAKLSRNKTQGMLASEFCKKACLLAQAFTVHYSTWMTRQHDPRSRRALLVWMICFAFLVPSLLSCKQRSWRWGGECLPPSSRSNKSAMQLPLPTSSQTLLRIVSKQCHWCEGSRVWAIFSLVVCCFSCCF